jgi:signal transduction histidine kinase
MKISLKYKFIILSVLSGIFVFSVFFYTFTLVKDLLEEREQASAGEVLSVINDEIEVLLSSYEKDLRLVANLNDLKEIYSFEKFSSVDEEIESEFNKKIDDLEKIFLSFMREREEYYQLRYIDENGQEIIRVDREGRNETAKIVEEEKLKNKADRNYFKSTMALSPGKVFVSEMDLNIEDGEIEVPLQPVIRFGIPIFDSSQNNKGIVVINVFADALLRLLENSPYRTTYLVDQDGYFLFKPDEVEKEWSRYLGNNFIYEDFSNRKNLFQSLFRTNNFVALDPVLSEADHKQFYYKIEYTVNDVSRYWVLITEVKLSDFFSGYNNLRDRILFINLLAVFGVIIIFSIFVIYFTRPIKYLQKAVEYLNLGRYDLELPVVSRDEFGEFTKKLNFLSKKIRENEKEKYEFIKSASHQLRTPASSMRFQLDLLKEDFQKKRGGAKVVKALNDIEFDLDRATTVVNDLLKYVEVGDNYFATNLSKINVLEMIEEIVRTFDEEIYRKKLDLKIKIPGDLNIEADEIYIKDAFVYLISNAVQYSNDGGEVVIYAEKRENEVYFEISDTGIGIPKKEQLRMFEKFFRASNAYAKKGVGSGLGMVITKNIIKGHGGELKFESRENKGTKFFFSIFDSKK